MEQDKPLYFCPVVLYLYGFGFFCFLLSSAFFHRLISAVGDWMEEEDRNHTAKI